MTKNELLCDALYQMSDEEYIKTYNAVTTYDDYKITETARFDKFFGNWGAYDLATLANKSTMFDLHCKYFAIVDDGNDDELECREDPKGFGNHEDIANRYIQRGYCYDLLPAEFQKYIVPKDWETATE